MKKKWINVRTWQDVKAEIKELLAEDERSHLSIFKEAGLSVDLYYKLFDPEREFAPMRKSTVRKLAKALGVDCTYHHGLPYFGAISVHYYTRNGSTIKEILAIALSRLGGDLGRMSERTGLSVDELDLLLDSRDEADGIRISTLRKIAEILDLNLSIWSDSSVAFEKGAATVPELSRSAKSNWIDDIEVTEELSPFDDIDDEGLIELLDYRNITKHSIRDDEIKELIYIHERHYTDATVHQWLLVLYAIRGLEPKL